jgi:hypothetical protein
VKKANTLTLNLRKGETLAEIERAIETARSVARSWKYSTIAIIDHDGTTLARVQP